MDSIAVFLLPHFIVKKDFPHIALILREKQHMIILLYHNLETGIDTKKKKGFDYQIYTVNQKKFEGHMSYLKNQSYQTISLSDLIDVFCRKQSILPEKSIIITLDDGHISNYTLAYPILKKYRFKATFFVTAGWVGLPDYLSWKQIREMNDNGMEIGSHALTHPNLTELNPEQIKFELEKSKKILEDKLGKPINFLAIPGSHYNSKIKRIAREVGYLAVCTGGWKPGYRYNDLYDLKRLGIKGYISMSDFVSLLEIKGKACFYRHIEVFLKSLFKRILGIDRYRWIRNRWFRLRLNEMREYR